MEIGPNLTLTMGLAMSTSRRSPRSTAAQRISTLPPDSLNVAVVTPGQPGPTPAPNPAGLITPIATTGLRAWRLRGSALDEASTIVRAGYGIYYNEQVYTQPRAAILAQQPPFAVSNAVNTSNVNNLTYTANTGFLPLTPRHHQHLRGGPQLSHALRRHLERPSNTISPGGFFAELGYLGTKGTQLDVRILPNQRLPAVHLQPSSATNSAMPLVSHMISPWAIPSSMPCIYA